MKRLLGLARCHRVILSLLLGSAMAPGAPAADTPLTSDQQTQLEAIRAEALAYIGKLPNFVCTQVTQREVLVMTSAGSQSQALGGDEIEETLTYFDYREHYEVLSINGRKVTGVEHAKITGALSTGDFGSALRSIFDPRAKTVFTWDRTASLRGRTVSVFAFRVPIEAGAPITDSRSKKQIVVSYDGRVFVDAETKEVLRITTRFNLPRGFRMSSAEQVVEYRPIEIAGRKHNLPFHSEVRIEEAGYVYLNKIDFKAYRKFETQSTIRYGAFAEPPSPNQMPGAPSTTPTAAASESDPPAAQVPERQSAATQETQLESRAAPMPVGESEVGPSVPPAVTSPPARTESLQKHEPEASQVAQPEAPNPPLDHATDDSVRLKVSAELVLVPVVVRDEAGRAVGNLTKDDFELLDKGKRQEITSFSLETRGQAAMERHTDGAASAAAEVAPRSLSMNAVVYLFDDLHLKFGDMAQVRQAADRQIDTLQAGDEAAVLSTSGLVQLAFTADKAKLHEALSKLRASPLGDRAEHGCPEVSFYQADQILNVYPLDPAVSPPLQVAVADAIACLHGGDTRDSLQGATKFALTAAIDTARRTEDEGKRNTRGALLAIKDVLRWLSSKPGNKTLVLVSSGFILTTDQLAVEGGVIDQAIGSHVSISTLDARGLFTAFPTAEFAGRPTDSTAFRMKLDLMRQEAVESDVVLKDLADGTGGGFVRNTNDLLGGLQRLAAPPAYTYVLGFKPEHMKSDGRFHALTVKLKKGSRLTTQARRGYFAPKQ